MQAGHAKSDVHTAVKLSARHFLIAAAGQEIESCSVLGCHESEIRWDLNDTVV